MHHRRPAAPHSHRPNHRQINRLMPFTTAPLFHALQLLETGEKITGAHIALIRERWYNTIDEITVVVHQ